MTLLDETKNILTQAGKTGDDVRFVSADDQHGTWSDFVSIANFDYHSGYGGNEIMMSLKIVGDNWWLERGEYDGSEWWEFKTLPSAPDKAEPLKNIRKG